MVITTYETGTEWEKDVTYSQIVRVPGGAPLLYTAGLAAFDDVGEVVGVDDVQAQIRQVFANLQRTLAAADRNLSDLVKMTVYVTQREYYEDFRSLRAEFLSPPYPASTLVIVAGLAYPELLVEMDAVAIAS